jgi:hypothetical protein
MNLFAVRRLASAHRPPWGGSAMDEERQDGWFRAGHGRRSMPANTAARPGNGQDAIAPNSRHVPASACASSMTSQPVAGGRASAAAMSSVRAVVLRAASPSALTGAGGPSPARSGCRTMGVGAGAARRKASAPPRLRGKHERRRVDHLRPPSRSQGIGRECGHGGHAGMPERGTPGNTNRQRLFFMAPGRGWQGPSQKGHSRRLIPGRRLSSG